MLLLVFICAVVSVVTGLLLGLAMSRRYHRDEFRRLTTQRDQMEALAQKYLNRFIEGLERSQAAQGRAERAEWELRRLRGDKSPTKPVQLFTDESHEPFASVSVDEEWPDVIGNDDEPPTIG